MSERTPSHLHPPISCAWTRTNAPARPAHAPAAGKIKRQLVLAELTGVEEWPASSGRTTEDIERSLVFKFAPGQSSEAKRDLLFNNKRQRDAFLEEARAGAGGDGGAAPW